MDTEEPTQTVRENDETENKDEATDIMKDKQDVNNKYNENEEKETMMAPKKERTKLISKELLSDEEILKIGIDKDDVNLYRMKKFKEAFTLDKWINIKELNELTFDTRFVSVTGDEANSFITYCRYTQSQIMKRRGIDTYSKTIEEYNNNKEKINGDINNLKQKINEEIDDAKWNECGFFAKFNSRSPKDVHEYEGDQQYVTNIFFDEMDKFNPNKDGNVDINEALIASYVSRAKLLKMKTGDDVINTFSRSFRSLEDLTGTLRLGTEHMDISIALRKWNDYVPTSGHGEFRCFVHNKKLNAITQYISCVWFKGLERQKNEIKQRILDFYENKIKEYVPMDSFVIDFLVLGIKLDHQHNVHNNNNDDDDDDEKKDGIDDNIYIIEFNPFYKSAGAGLFDWRCDRELFLNGPCEIRVRNELDPKGTDYFHPSWIKSYEKYTGKNIRPQHTKNNDKKKNDGNNENKKRCVIL